MYIEIKLFEYYSDGFCVYASKRWNTRGGERFAS